MLWLPLGLLFSYTAQARLLSFQPDLSGRVNLKADDSSFPEAHCSDAAPVLHYMMQLANRYIESSHILTSATVDVMGKPDNRLDPLDFNGKTRAHAGQEVCSEKRCVTALGKELCLPAACSAVEATAQLTSLHGLSSVRLTNVTCSDVVRTGPDTLTANGEIVLKSQELSSDALAQASAIIAGKRALVSSSGKVTVANARVTALMAVNLTTIRSSTGKHNYQVVNVTVSDLRIAHGPVAVHINNLSMFDSLLKTVVRGIEKEIEKHFDIDGAIANALLSQLDEIVAGAVPDVNNMLKKMQF